MPGVGPPPKEQRRRRNADTYADVKTVVADDGERSGQALGGVWSQPVLDWWETWRRSPQAKAFVGTDWQRLRMLAPLVAQYWECPETKILAEIRQNETLLGATYTDRLRARMKVDKPASEPETVAAGVTALDEYRRSLAG